MAVNNSLVKKSKAQQNLGITAYLTQDAIKNQINQVVGGKNGQRLKCSRRASELQERVGMAKSLKNSMD